MALTLFLKPNQPTMTRLILFVGLLVFLIQSSFAQSGDEAIRIYPPSVYKAGPSIYHFVKDKKGILYIASNKGIIEYDGSNWNLIPISNYSDAGILVIDDDDRIYVGATNEFGYLETDSLGEMRYISLINLVDPELRNSGDIWQVLIHRNKILFQSYNGIYSWDKEHTIEFIPIDDVYIFNIEGVLYASQFGSGVFGRLNGDSIESIPSAAEIMDTDLIFSVFPYDDDQHLLSTSDNGLFLFNPESESIKPFQSAASKFLDDNGFFDGALLDDNIYCFGTWEKGLIFTNRSGEILKQIDNSSGLLANMIYHVLRGNANDLWVGTDNGIARLDLDSLGIKLNKGDDIPLITRVGEISTELSVLKGEHLEISEINISDQRPASITLHFCTPAWSGSDIEFSYILEGFDEDWSEWSIDSKKEYTNLSGGDYTFKVRSRQKLSMIEAEEASIELTLPVFWYETIWFYVGIIAILIGIFYLGSQLRTLRLKSANKKLAMEIDKNTNSLRKQKDELKELNKDLSVANKELDSFVYHTSHDLKAPLKSIIGLTNLAKRETLDDNILLYFTMIEGSVIKLEEFITSIIDYSANSKSKVSVEEINFEELIADTKSMLFHFENIDKIEISSEVKIDSNFYSDPKRIKIVLGNLLSNAIKYHDLNKDNPFININVEQNNGSVNIEVEDNGSGISKNHQDKIFEMFYRASESSFGSGLGLYIVKETVAKLNGQIDIESDAGKGSIFRVEFPDLSQH